MISVHDVTACRFDQREAGSALIVIWDDALKRVVAAAVVPATAASGWVAVVQACLERASPHISLEALAADPRIDGSVQLISRTVLFRRRQRPRP